MPTPRRPAVGEAAPSFALPSHHGESRQLPMTGGGPCAVMFFPFAFSSVCGSELSALHARRDELLGIGAEVLAVSCDPVHALRAYAETLSSGEPELGFTLLSDFWPHGRVADSFGVFDEERGAPERATFILDAGLIVRRVQHVPAGQARDLDEMVAELARIAGPAEPTEG